MGRENEKGGKRERERREERTRTMEENEKGGKRERERWKERTRTMEENEKGEKIKEKDRKRTQKWQRTRKVKRERES